MRFHINKSELSAHKFACVLHDFKYAVMPSMTKDMLEFTVKKDGGELSQLEAYYLGRAVLQYVEIEKIRRELPSQELPLSESDLMPNDVVILVEDLPR